MSSSAIRCTRFVDDPAEEIPMKLVIPVLLLACTLTVAAKEGEGKKPAPSIEVCFVLDTTGSMGGLIDGAKQKIWSIANTIIATEPRPTVRIALVGYRDRGDAYVTKRFDLTDDIDTVFKNLTDFQADG